MPDIQPYRGGNAVVPRDARRLARSTSSTHVSSELRTVQIDSETDLAISKVTSLTAVTASMLGEVTRVGQLQAQLELIAPAVSGRLNMLADAHAFGLVDLEADYRRSLRRI